MNEIVCVEGSRLRVRPIELTDVDRLTRMFDRLSPETVYNRFFSPLPHPPRALLLRLAHVDHRCRDALVALDGDEIVAVARYDGQPRRSDTGEAEIAVTVEDAWHRRGLGRLLVGRLADLARGRGFDAFVARILPTNRAALGLLRDLAPEADVRFTDGDYEALVPLTAARMRVPEYRAVCG